MRSQIIQEHIVTTLLMNDDDDDDKDVEVVLKDGSSSIEHDDAVEVVLNPSAVATAVADLFSESRSVSSLDAEHHLHTTCTTTGDLSQQSEHRDDDVGDDDDANDVLSDHPLARLSISVCNDKNYDSSTMASSPSAASITKVEVVFESNCNHLNQNLSLEQEKPMQQELNQNNGMMDTCSRRTKPSIRFGNFVYQVVSRQGAAVYPNDQDLTLSLENDENQNRDYHDSKTTKAFLNYRQMIQVDQVAQINSLDIKKESKVEGTAGPAKCAVTCNSAEIVRLAHGEGWVAAEGNGKALLKPLPVWTGLWCWYVHYNCTDGLVITKHPTNPTLQDSLSSKDSILLPLQKIYCDAKVVDDIDGTTYYRLQTKSSLRSLKCQTQKSEATHKAATEHVTQWNGWICDRTAQGESTLLAEEQVKTNLELVVCNSLQVSMPVYGHASGKEEDEGQMKIPPAEMVVVRTMVWPDKENTRTAVASCMQLADLSGWVVVHSSKTSKMSPQTQEAQVTAGNWKFRVMHEQGIKSYTHPSTKLSDQSKEDNDYIIELYPYASILQCDTRVTNPATGQTYFRLRDSGRWIPSEQESSKKQESVKKWVRRKATDNFSWLIELFEVDRPSESVQGQIEDEQVWNPDFVSGIAATIPGLKKVSTLGPDGSPLFDAKGGVRIHVFCAQRSVDIELKHQVYGKVRLCQLNCSTYDLCHILRMDPMELVSTMDAIDVDGIHMEHLPEGGMVDDQAENEERLRYQLLCCSSKVNSLLKMQRSLVTQLATIDGKRQIDIMRDMKKISDCESITHTLDTELTRLSWLTQTSSGWEADSTGTHDSSAHDTDCTTSKQGSIQGLLKTRRKPRSRQNRDRQNVRLGFWYTTGSVHCGLKDRANQV